MPENQKSLQGTVEPASGTTQVGPAPKTPNQATAEQASRLNDLQTNLGKIATIANAEGNPRMQLDEIRHLANRAQMDVAAVIEELGNQS